MTKPIPHSQDAPVMGKAPEKIPQDRLIILVGCDDQTRVTLPLTDTEYQSIVSIAEEINNNSSSRCQPTIHISATARVPGHACTRDEYSYCEFCHEWGEI